MSRVHAGPVEIIGENSSSLALAPARVFTGASIPQVMFSFAAMLGACLVGRVFYALRSFHVDPDLWWHLKYGESILTSHHWPTTEAYSFTAAGQHWLAYEWLGDVLFAAVYRVGGLRGLGALLIILGSLFALALYYFTSMRCGNPKAGFLATAVLLNLTNFFNLRPQMLGYVFLIFALILLERFRLGKRRTIWLLPLLMLAWINTHGSWVIGLGTIAAYLACGLVSFRMGNMETKRWTVAVRRQLTIVFALSVIAILVTPYGTGLAKFPVTVGSSPLGIANIQEWQPVGFEMPGDKLFLGLFLGFFLVQIVLRPKWRFEELGLFLFGIAMACSHARFLSLFAIFFAPILVVILTRWLPRYDRAKEIYFLNGAIILVILGAMFWYFPSRDDYASTVDKEFPVAAVQYLNTHSVPGPMYNSYEFGGYLLWARAPEHKVFIDGRTEVYERAGVFADQVNLINLKPGSLAIFQKYGIQSCLLSPGEATSTVLAALPDWQKLFEDSHSVLYVRRQIDASAHLENASTENSRGAGGGT